MADTLSETARCSIFWSVLREISTPSLPTLALFLHQHCSLYMPVGLHSELFMNWSVSSPILPSGLGSGSRSKRRKLP